MGHMDLKSNWFFLHQIYFNAKTKVMLRFVEILHNEKFPIAINSANFGANTQKNCLILP